MRASGPRHARSRDERPVLVTGGAGFIGCNLADRLAAAGHRVIIYDSLVRPGVEANLDWLRRRHPRRISPVIADIRDRGTLGQAVREAQAVFHFAAQVAVTTSLLDPAEDFKVNAQGTLQLLELIRRLPRRPALVFASTNKVYGDLGGLALENDGQRYFPREPAVAARGIDEAQPLDFHTPYGCSKGTADQYVLEFARSFGLPAAVLRMSCIYGPRQLGNEDQGWVAHFLRQAIAGEVINLYGDGCQVRDLLHVGDAVEAYLGAWRAIESIAGRAFNLGGGPENAVSLLEVIAEIEAILGRPVGVAFGPWRAGDQRYYVSDARAVRRSLGLAPARGWRDGLADLAAWLGRDETMPRPVLAAAAARSLGAAS
jgi:CDP-paratose 2-epimerase